MENSFKTLIDSAQEILILLPNNHTFDHVAGGLSVFLSLLNQKKKVTISCHTPMVTEYSRLVGVDKITQELGSDVLAIKLIDYVATNVDKVSYDIEKDQFKLTITPKSGFKAPTKEQINISYSGTSGDLILLIGGNTNSDFPAFNTLEFQDVKTIHLGTKILEVTNNDIKILSFATPASSISELVAILLRESEYPIDQDVATNLLSGIEEQSDNFQNNQVTSDTFLVFAELMKLGGVRKSKTIPVDGFPQGSIPTKPFTTQVQPVFKDKTMTLEKAEEEIQQDIPPSWSEPKIFTGTSLS